MAKYFAIDSDIGIFKKIFSPLINNSIKISNRVLFNCMSFADSFLAIGSNTGTIYIFTIYNETFKYFDNVISSDAAVDNLEFSPSKLYFVCSNIKSQIFIYKLNLNTENVSLVRKIDSSHNSFIHSFVWDEENSRIICGYKNAAVDFVYVPSQNKDIFYYPTENILKSDKQSLIQMDFVKDTLLISTNEKVFLLNLLSKFSILIGSKPRLGQFGACFWYGESKVLKVITARPNFRMWIADIDGTVEETQQYKNPINALKYKIHSSGDDLQGTGQFSWFSPVRNNLIFAGDTGLIFLIDLVMKSCLITIDCGSNLTKTICSSFGVMILNTQKEINNIAIISMKDALLQIINENLDAKYAIDLFLSLDSDLEFHRNAKCDIDVRRICNSFPPSLLSTIVQKAAELDYRFAETNKLQVQITDNDDYQKMFYSICTDNVTARTSNSNSTDFTVESSNDLSVDSVNSQSHTMPHSKRRFLPDKLRNMSRVILDTTSRIMSEIEASGSHSSEINLMGLITNPDSYCTVDHKEEISLKSNSINILSENSEVLNIMELEANVYIAWEKMKTISNFQKPDDENDFLDSLSNFCESWLTLNLQNWRNLFNLELRVRNLSASFPNFSLKSLNSNENSEIDPNNFFTNNNSNYFFENSWSCTINPSEWIKPLVISDKIIPMTSVLISYCFSYGIFSHFLDLIQDIINVTSVDIFHLNPNCIGTDFECNSDMNNKLIETDLIPVKFSMKTSENPFRFPDLLDILTNSIWPMEYNYNWIKSMLLLFHSVTDMTMIRNWLKSSMSQDIWMTIVNCMLEIHSSIFNEEKYRFLSTKSPNELDDLLFSCLCINNVDSLLYTDQILEYLNQHGTINWKIITDSENLSCREMLHLSIKYNLDLTNYIIGLFNLINWSAKFHSRNQLIGHFYSEPDVLISFVYTLLANCDSDTVKLQSCVCGMITTYSSSNLPNSIYQIVLEILKWGSDNNIFKSNLKLLEILTKINIDMGFHEGYVELLVGTNDITQLIQIGLQTSNFQVLQRIKDCGNLSKQSIKKNLENLVFLHRKQIFAQCLRCNRIIDERPPYIQPMSFKSIGELIISTLIVKNNYQDIHDIIKMLTNEETDLIKEYLMDSIYKIVNSRKVIVKNQMFNFINNEINQTEETSKLTEMFLNIYGMNYSELCGNNWGKILTQNMHCDLCGTVLIGGTAVEPDKANVISFSCSHTFHKKCLQEIGCVLTCFMC